MHLNVSSICNKGKNIIVFYGSQTGTAEEFANRLSKDAQRYGMKGMAADPEEYDMVITELEWTQSPSHSFGFYSLLPSVIAIMISHCVMENVSLAYYKWARLGFRQGSTVIMYLLC